MEQYLQNTKRLFSPSPNTIPNPVHCQANVALTACNERTLHTLGNKATVFSMLTKN